MKANKLFQTTLLLSFLVLNSSTSLMAQTKGSRFIPTFARKDNTAIASRTIEVKEHGWLYFRKNAKVKPNELFSTYREAMGLGKEDDMKIIKSQEDDMGYSHNIYEQRYKGILIQNAGFSEHFKNGYVEVAHGKIIEKLNIDVVPSLKEAEALQVALDSIGAKEYAWQNPKAEKALQIESNDPSATYFPKGQLVITNVKNEVFLAENYRLAWVFEVNASSPLANQYIYIDAHNGRIIKRRDMELHNGPAQTLYYGTQNIDTQFQGFWYGNQFRLMADDNGRNIHTKKGSSGWNNLGEVNDADDVWTGENTDATTAHWTVSKAWDFYQGYFNRNGCDGSGARVLVKSESNGTSSQLELNDWRIKFNPAPVSSNQQSTVDIAAHEFTHGVLHYTCGPGSNGNDPDMSVGENGAIAESLGDIMGLMAERYTLGASANNLTHGEDCGFVFRRFDSRNFNIPDPNSSLFGQPFPTAFGQAGWIDPNSNTDDGGVHINCAVMNFWFYLLTQGGSQNNITVNPIGYDKAAQIVYRAINCGYLSNTSDFFGAREATMRAALELYGGCTIEDIEVANAWAAVSVGGVKLCPVSIYGPNNSDVICVPISNFTYYFSASEFSNSTFSWTYPNGWTAQASGNYLGVSSFGYSTVGDYEAITATSNLTQQTGTFYVSFEDCSSYSIRRNDEPTQSNYNFKAYPNPVVDKLTLEFPINENIQTISIFDNLGRLVLSQLVSAQQTELDVADFNTGLYLIKALGEHNSHTLTFIKK